MTSQSRRAPGILAAVALMWLVGGCTELPITCPSLPCPYGLQIELVGDLPAEFTLELAAEARAQPWIQECTELEPCGRFLEFPFFVPPSVELTYRTGDTVVVDTLRPEYRTTERDDRCGGDCEFAHIEWHVPHPVDHDR